MVLRRLFCGKMVKLENAAPRCAASICCRALASARFPPNGHPECPWLATLQDAWARAMFCWQRGKLAGDECLRVAVSDVRLSAIIASEAAARGKRPPPAQEELGRQNNRTYCILELQHVFLNIWTNVSLLSRPQVKKSPCSDSRRSLSLVRPWRRVKQRSERDQNLDHFCVGRLFLAAYVATRYF